MLRESRTVILLKLSPILIPFLIMFTGGILFTLLQSLGYVTPIPVEGGPFRAFRELFSTPWFYRSFLFSVYVGLVSAAAAVILGTVLSYFVWRLPLAKQKYAIVYKIPLILPHIAVAFITLILFSRSGFLSSVLKQAGVLDSQEAFPAILYAGNGLGIILAYVYKEVPFVMLMVMGILMKLDPRHLITARMLGASRARSFIHIVVPFLLPVINTTYIFLFLYAFGAFDIPFLLSESRPEMLSIYVYNLYFKRDLINRPYAMSVLLVMLLFSGLFILVYTRLASRLEAGERKL